MNMRPILQVGLAILWQAHQFAEDSGMNPAEFAVEFDSLQQAGLNRSEVRWLIAKKLAEHYVDTTTGVAENRQFVRRNSLKFEPGSCFVLTSRGAAMTKTMVNFQAIEHSSDLPIDLTTQPPANLDGNSLAALKPTWDSNMRQLSFRGLLVKTFRVPARNQSMILDAFEEEGWPTHLDDPLPVQSGIDPHARLHDAINRLNRRQINEIVRFIGDGSGEGVCWKPRKICDENGQG